MATVNEKVYYLDKEKEAYVMHDHVAVQYRRVMMEQLRLWKEGVNKHSDQLGPDFVLPEGLEGECVPDMACCQVTETTQEERDFLFQLYQSGNFEAAEKMCFDFLEKALSEAVSEAKLHLAGKMDKQELKH